jgi:hypothetical protein
MLGAALCAAAFLSGGCLINSHSRTEYSGDYVGTKAMDRIQIGESRQDFVLATLGEPTCKSHLDDGTDLWKWRYKKTHSGNGSVFLLIAASDRTEQEGAACIVFRDGVVEKKWRD